MLSVHQISTMQTDYIQYFNFSLATTTITYQTNCFVIVVKFLICCPHQSGRELMKIIIVRYTGYCPRLRFKCGRTYGADTDKLTRVRTLTFHCTICGDNRQLLDTSSNIFRFHLVDNCTRAENELGLSHHRQEKKSWKKMKESTDDLCLFCFKRC